MSYLKQLLSELRTRGIKLWVEGERLRYGAPKGALTPALRKQVIQRKAELITCLSRRDLKLIILPDLMSLVYATLSVNIMLCWYVVQ